jgi:hexosaminidase
VRVAPVFQPLAENGAIVKTYRSLLMSAVILAAAQLAHAGVGDVIPRPVEVKELAGSFTLTPQTIVCVDSDAKDAADTAQQLADLLDKPLGATLEIKSGAVPGNSILLTTKDADASLGDEGYSLVVKPGSVVITAKTSAGLFYGMQSLRQLLPPQIESRERVTDVAWTVPCVQMKDSPRFGWRGLMLDVSRHFEDKTEVERLLDLMALHKLNVFHWHLVDDQGWRIEIKKYPKLTEIGAWRDGIGFKLDPKRSTHYRADGKYGGFYTQDDIREVVAYAAKLHITIVPEIEMPGHSQAALAAYPQFGCTKTAMDVGMKAGVMDAIYDPSDAATYAFLDDVLTEVAALFPGEFIHIGGDEVPKGPWKKSERCQAFMKEHGLKDENELQSYFVKRMEKVVESKHRRLIGWDEILEGGLAPGAAVMSWRGINGGIAAAKEDHDVVMTPTSNLYLDYSQTKRKGEPPTIGGYLPLKNVYSYDPIPKNLTPDQARHVLGAQGNIWTEYMPNLNQVELMAFPRACALAEVAWTPKDRMDYTDFQRRLDLHEKRLDVLGVKYFSGPDQAPTPAGTQIGNWKPAQMGDAFAPLSWDAGKAINKSGKYAVTMQYTEGACRLDIKWMALLADGAEISRDTHDGRTGGEDNDNEYHVNVPDFKAGTKYTLVAQVRSDGGTDSNGTVSIGAEP